VLITGARPGDARVPYALLARVLRAALQWQTLEFEPWVRHEPHACCPNWARRRRTGLNRAIARAAADA